VSPAGGVFLDGVEQPAALNLKPADFHGEWNYKLLAFRKKIVMLFFSDS
jgi:hypothetical protein